MKNFWKNMVALYVIKYIENYLAGGHDWGCTSVCGNGAKWTVEILDEAKKDKK